MRVYGQLEFAQMHQSIPASIGAGKGGQFYADITTPAAIIPKFHDGSVWRRLVIDGQVFSEPTGPGTAGQYLASSGAVATPALWTTFRSPVTSQYKATNYYTFTVTAANATAGATYTNNSVTFTVADTIAGALVLVCSCPTGSAPTASGTLTKSGGTGDATITFSAQTNSGTYFPPSGACYLELIISAGGGGGSGSGTAAAGNGGNGGNSTFGSTLVSCPGGAGGGFTSSPTLGTAPTITAPAIELTSVAGGTGGGGAKTPNAATTATWIAPPGGTNPLGGAAGGYYAGGGFGGGAANTGAGGCGGGIATAITSGFLGNSGTAGAYARVIIPATLAASYLFQVGDGGTLGTLGTSGSAGFKGGSGVISIVAHFQ